MAFEPFAGTSGRLKAIKVAPNLTTDVITFTGSTVTLPEVTGWDINWTRDGGSPEVMTFEAAADAEGTLYPTKIRGGAARWSITIQCVVDGDTTNSFEKMPPGAAIVMDALYHKSSSRGFIGLNVVTTSMPTKTSVTDKTATFTLTADGTGALPSPTI